MNESSKWCRVFSVNSGHAYGNYYSFKCQVKTEHGLQEQHTSEIYGKTHKNDNILPTDITALSYCWRSCAC